MNDTSLDPKFELRRDVIQRIRAMDTETRQQQDRRLLELFSTLPEFRDSECVMLYVATFEEEISTQRLYEHAKSEGKRVFLPRIARNPRRLQLVEVRDAEKELQFNRLGIAEPRNEMPDSSPAVVDWALIPGLAFDRRGYRLGRGGGYYDRLIPQLRSDAICWGLGYDCQLVENVPRETHDAPLNGVTVPSGTYIGKRKPT